jgi:predicted small lipoprotein YifL
MSVRNNKPDELFADAAVTISGGRTRRRFLGASTPLLALVGGALSACGKKGDLQPPPPAAPASTGSTEDDTQ